MPRGYRSVILAIAGLILIGSSKAPQPPAKAEQQQTEATESQPPSPVAPVAAEAAKAVEPPEYYQPCGDKGSNSNSDLCAQWSAAKAASEAARWAWWQLWLSLAGVIGLGLTLWFNFRALRLAEKESEETKGALGIAARNADAATEQVAISRESSHAELRPYIINTGGIAFNINTELQRSHIAFGLRNYGRTPAMSTKVTVDAYVGESASAAPLFPIVLRTAVADIPHSHDINFAAAIPLTVELMDELGTDVRSLFIKIAVRCTPVWGPEIDESIHYRWDGDRGKATENYEGPFFDSTTEIGLVFTWRDVIALHAMIEQYDAG